MDDAAMEPVSATLPDVCERCLSRDLTICRVLLPPELRALVDRAQTLPYGRGELLARQGEPMTHVFNITSGTVMLFRLMPDGRRQVLRFLHRGDFLGLVREPEYAFSVEALETVEACRIPRGSFDRLLRSNLVLEDELLSRASRALSRANDQLVMLGRKTAVERVASFLLALADRQQTHGGSPDVALLPMTRRDIADYLGLTTETVCRAFSTLKRQGTIEVLGADGIRLVRRPKLEALAECA